MNRAPGGYEAGIAMKAGTAAAPITDYERKAVAARGPYFYVFDRCDNATKLHDTPQKSAPALLRCTYECYVTGGRFAISEWCHDIKYDGYRLARGDRVLQMDLLSGDEALGQARAAAQAARPGRYPVHSPISRAGLRSSGRRLNASAAHGASAVHTVHTPTSSGMAPLGSAG